MKFRCSILALLACQCGKQLPPNTPGDVGDAVACVMTDVLAQKPIDDCIAKFGRLAIDILQVLSDSAQLTAENPAAHDFAAAEVKAHASEGSKKP
jgi:hypothetical protein